MPPPAAAAMAAAGLLPEVAPPRATLTLVPARVGDARPDPNSDAWFALTAFGRALPGAVRVAVIRGAFSASGPLRSLFTGNPGDGSAIPRLGRTGGRGGPADDVEARVAEIQQAVAWLRRPDLVSVAAVSGPAEGPGAALALACDLRIVTHDASFAVVEPAAGGVPVPGVAGELVEAVGYGRALELSLTGRVVGAAEAVRLGLAQLAVDPADLDAAVDDLTAALLTAPRGAAAETKALLLAAARRGRTADLAAAEREAAARCLADLDQLS